MSRKLALYLVAILAFLILVLPFGYGDSASAETPGPAPTEETMRDVPTGVAGGSPSPPEASSTPAFTATPAATPSAGSGTAEVDPTSAPEEEELETTGEGVVETVGARTPVPTATAGVITEAVAVVAEVTSLDVVSFLGITAEDWINLGISILISLAGYVIGGWVFAKGLRALARRTATDFDDLLLDKIGRELSWLVAIPFFRLATNRLSSLGEGLRRFLFDVYYCLAVAVVLLIVWKVIDFAVEWVHNRIAADEDRKRLDPVIILVQRLSQGIACAMAVTILLGHFGINFTVLLASLGVIGLAVSLAAQDTLSDAISGVTILVDRPFRVGDRIEISDLGTWGDVVEIGMRSTRIHTRDNRLVIVPNSSIGKSQVVNYTFPDPRYRVQIHIGIGYGVDIETARRVIVDTVRHVEGVLPDKPVDALYVEMGESVMTFRVRWWIESYADTRRMFDRVNTALQEALDEARIEMPFQTYNVNLNLGPKAEIRFVEHSETSTGATTPSGDRGTPSQ
jgi:MscS family membrane protein